MDNVIPFTQYLRPNGQKKGVSIERPAEIAAEAHRMIDAGCRFECEVLICDLVGLTVVGPDDEGDVAVRVVPNGPGIHDAVDLIVAEAARYMAREGDSQ